jgi:hypothetical protein
MPLLYAPVFEARDSIPTSDSEAAIRFAIPVDKGGSARLKVEKY